jgi:hypothetical protein
LRDRCAEKSECEVKPENGQWKIMSFDAGHEEVTRGEVDVGMNVLFSTNARLLICDRSGAMTLGRGGLHAVFAALAASPAPA